MDFSLFGGCKVDGFEPSWQVERSEIPPRSGEVRFLPGVPVKFKEYQAIIYPILNYFLKLLLFSSLSILAISCLIAFFNSTLLVILYQLANSFLSLSSIDSFRFILLRYNFELANL